jgi:hypothetical protein
MLLPDRMAPVDALLELVVEGEALVWELRKGCVTAAEWDARTEGVNQN